MTRKPGDLIRAFNAKKQKASGLKKKLAPALTPSHNPGSMVGMTPKIVDRNPNSPANYGPAMLRALANTKVFRKGSKKRKASSGLPPKNFGKKQQERYAKDFGLPTASSTRTRTKRKASKLDMEMAFKKKRKSSKKKVMMDDCA